MISVLFPIWGIMTAQKENLSQLLCNNTPVGINRKRGYEDYAYINTKIGVTL